MTGKKFLLLLGLYINKIAKINLTVLFLSGNKSGRVFVLFVWIILRKKLQLGPTKTVLTKMLPAEK